MVFVFQESLTKKKSSPQSNLQTDVKTPLQIVDWKTERIGDRISILFKFIISDYSNVLAEVGMNFRDYMSAKKKEHLEGIENETKGLRQAKNGVLDLYKKKDESDSNLQQVRGQCRYYGIDFDKIKDADDLSKHFDSKIEAATERMNTEFYERMERTNQSINLYYNEMFNAINSICIGLDEGAWRVHLVEINHSSGPALGLRFHDGEKFYVFNLSKMGDKDWRLTRPEQDYLDDLMPYAGRSPGAYSKDFNAHIGDIGSGHDLTEIYVASSMDNLNKVLKGKGQDPSQFDIFSSKGTEYVQGDELCFAVPKGFQLPKDVDLVQR